MKNKIVVVGSSNVDLLMKMDRHPAMGETVTDAEFFQVYGGKGANQAVAVARSGGRVAFVNCVGEDAYTPRMVSNYEQDGIDTTAAGDIFCGALAVALLESLPMEETVRFDNAAVAISVTRMGEQPSAPERAEIDAFMRANP